MKLGKFVHVTEISLICLPALILQTALPPTSKTDSQENEKRNGSAKDRKGNLHQAQQSQREKFYQS
jgi:hypothetical protein